VEINRREFITGAAPLARLAAKAGCDWVSSVPPVYYGQKPDADFAAKADMIGLLAAARASART
jgi:dihydrodipicolinate synthase/N-acetylneuraminate lyase